MYVISECLLGVDCRYNGGNKKNNEVIEFSRTHSSIAVCPEIEGGLSFPRLPDEQARGAGGEWKVFDKDGSDLTAEFTGGARRAIERITEEAKKRGERLEGAILKANSPSCGSGTVYDGTFSGTHRAGDGVFAGMLKDLGIKVVTENEIGIFK